MSGTQSGTQSSTLCRRSNFLLIAMAKLRTTDVLKLPDGFYADENGLCLYVRGNSRTWVYRGTLNGKRVKRGLGSAKLIPLAMARQKALELSQNGVQETVKAVKFQDFYLEAIEHFAKIKQWKNKKSKSQWTNTIEAYALPVIGAKSLKSITSKDIRDILNPIYETKTETASRVAGRLKSIFDYAQVCGLHQGANPAMWVGNLDQFFAPKAKVSPEQHHKSLSWKELPAVFKALWGLGSIGALSVMFGTLTASRVNEFVPAQWSEIDRKNLIWMMPAGRRKDQKPFPHRVPLNDKLLMVLDRLPTREGDMFPSRDGSKHQSKETPRKALHDLGLDVTMHGMRSTFRDWSAETGHDYVASEKALSHAVGNVVTQAYLRTDMLEKRREIMQAWADWCFSEISKSS